MNRIIQINKHDIEVKEYKEQRVITLKDIDMVHERVEGTAVRSFTENRIGLIENKDLFRLIGDELNAYRQVTNFVGSNAREFILITESGYLMLVKSLTDDLDWKVKCELVNTYFRVINSSEHVDFVKEFKECFKHRTNCKDASGIWR